HFQRLLRDPPFTLVSLILDDDLQPLAPDDPLPVVAGYFATYDMVAAPVVDESGALLGVVTVDDVLDHMLPEDWRESELHLGDESDATRTRAGTGTATGSRASGDSRDSGEVPRGR